MICRIIDKKLNFNRPAWLVTDEELVNKHKFYNFVDTGYNPEYDTLNEPEYLIEGKSISYSFTRDSVKEKEYFRAMKLQELDRTYHNFLEGLYNQDKKDKYQMMYMSFLNKKLENIALTLEEQTEKARLEDLHRWYKGILANHETDKQYINSEDDVELLKNYVIEPE